MSERGALWRPQLIQLASSLSYLNVSSSGAQVFTWFQNLTTISGFLSWICVLIKQ